VNLETGKRTLNSKFPALDKPASESPGSHKC
jgi:hypothetical protein